jgi:hypothetical protein
MADDVSAEKVDPKIQAEVDKVNKERFAAIKEADEKRAKEIAGELDFNKPDHEDWPDSVPLQSRHGDPKDYVTPQSLQENQEPEDDDDKPKARHAPRHAETRPVEAKSDDDKPEPKTAAAAKA